MKICGIDPGLNGGIAFIAGDFITADRVPVLNITKGKSTKRFLDAWSIMRMIDDQAPDHVFIEKQQAMPKQGLSSTFATGFGYGIYIGLLVAARVSYTERSALSNGKRIYKFHLIRMLHENVPVKYSLLPVNFGNSKEMMG